MSVFCDKLGGGGVTLRFVNGTGALSLGGGVDRSI